MIAHHNNREKRAEGSELKRGHVVPLDLTAKGLHFIIAAWLYIAEGTSEGKGDMQSSNAIDPMAMECLSDGHEGSYIRIHAEV
jgi:hypothetical protein